MASLSGTDHVAWMRSDEPLEHTAGEITRMMITVDEGVRSIELAGWLGDGRRWTSSIPMPADWLLVRVAPGVRVVRVVTEPRID